MSKKEVDRFESEASRIVKDWYYSETANVAVEDEDGDVTVLSRTIAQALRSERERTLEEAAEVSLKCGPHMDGVDTCQVCRTEWRLQVKIRALKGGEK